MGFPGGSDCKEFTSNSGDRGSIPGWGRSPGGGHGSPPVFCLENPRTEEPGGLQSIGSQRVGQDWATNTMHWDAVWFGSLLGNPMRRSIEQQQQGTCPGNTGHQEKTPCRRVHSYIKSTFNTTRDGPWGSRDFRLLGWLEGGGASGGGTWYPRGIQSLCRSSSER